MTYNSKSIKINYFCRKLYEHTFMVLERDKPILSNLYVVHKFGENMDKELSKYQYNELFIEIIQEVKKKTPKQLLEIKQEIKTRERIMQLQQIMKLKSKENVRTNLSFRISEKVMEEIKKIKTDTGIQTISEVCEIAIMNYVNDLDEKPFELIVITMTKDFIERQEF